MKNRLKVERAEHNLSQGRPCRPHRRKSADNQLDRNRPLRSVNDSVPETGAGIRQSGRAYLFARKDRLITY